MKRVLWSVVIAAIITLLFHMEAPAQNPVAHPIDPFTEATRTNGNCSAANRGVSSRPIEEERHPFPRTFFQRRISIRVFR
jgi:hypothetical protein